MKRELFDKWLAALESGEYKQGNGALKEDHEDGVTRYCCLGVLLVVAGHTGVKQQGETRYYFGGPDMKCKEFLPYDFAAEQKMKTGGEVIDGCPVYLQDLAGMNDEGADFATIAAHLREKQACYVELEP